MPFNNLNAYKKRVESLSDLMLEKEHNKYVEHVSDDVATCIVSAGTAPFTGPFTYALTVHSAYKGFKHFDKYKIICNELDKRGLVVRRRKRDVIAPVILVVVTDVAVLGLKSVAKQILYK